MTVQKEADPSATAAVQPSSRSRVETLILIRKVWPWVFLLFLLIFFTITSQALNDIRFLNARSIQGILIFTTQILLIGLGETYQSGG
jgi:hypothetical protein